MENLGLLIIFWYGILHAFGADHLTAIADFSIGKNKTKTMLITFLFAIGHGIMLFIFAKILQYYVISDRILAYGDIISSSVIIFMGIYLLYMVYSNKIHLKKHIHNNKEHIHIYFGSEHNHNSRDIKSAFTIGAMMGIGGVAGALIAMGIAYSIPTIPILNLTFIVAGLLGFARLRLKAHQPFQIYTGFLTALLVMVSLFVLL